MFRPSMLNAKMLAAGLGLAGLVVTGHGLWIPAKALLAQGLLEAAWQRTQSSGAEMRPWPWADAWPIARLRVSDHGVNQIVLEGASGHVLAFAPGRDRSPQPGHTVIGGHRDTHFAFLEHVERGQAVELESVEGEVKRYRIAWTAIADHRDLDVLESDGEVLTLVTCWPFDAVLPGGPLRWVVRAELEPRETT